MISKRIRALASLINNDESVLDIGCDHGYLALAIRSQGNNSHIICVDNKIGPLNKAKENLSNLPDIDFVLSDGAAEVKKSVDVVVIAGVGYHTAIKILSDSAEYFTTCKRFILQVNTKDGQLRHWLNKNGYCFKHEVIIYEEKYYEIEVVEKGYEQFSDEELTYGPLLIKENTPVFQAYMNDKIKKNQQILDKMQKRDKKYFDMVNKINQLKDLVQVCDNS